MPGITFTMGLKNKKWVLILRGGTEAVPYKYIHKLSAIKYYRDFWHGIQNHKGEGGQIYQAVNQSKHTIKKGHNENITRINGYIYKSLDME